MRVLAPCLITVGLLLTGSAFAQTTPPAVDPGPAIAGNSDPAMSAKPKAMHMKKHKMHSKKKMMK